MPRLLYSRQALADLDAIDELIASDNPARARSYVEEIRELCSALIRHPHLGPARDSLGQGIRVLPYKRRVVVAYRVTADAVRIVRIYYGGQEQ